MMENRNENLNLLANSVIMNTGIKIYIFIISDEVTISYGLYHMDSPYHVWYGADNMIHIKSDQLSGLFWTRKAILVH